jgi:hypothetical protein
MLQISLDELPPAGPQQMLPRKVGPHDGKRHSVLQLIAKAVCAAGLIKGGSRPDAAGKRLIEHPAIEDDIHGPIGRFHLNSPEHVLPMLDHLSKDRIEIGIAVFDEQRLRADALSASPRKKTTFIGLPGLQCKMNVAERSRDRGRRRRAPTGV